MNPQISFLDGTLKVRIGQCIVIVNGVLTYFQGKDYTLPANCDGLLAIHWYSGEVTVYEDMSTGLAAGQHPEWVFLEYVATRNGVLVQHTPLTGPMIQSMLLSNQIWGMVANMVQFDFPLGGDTGFGNFYNGYQIPISPNGATPVTVTMSRKTAPGFYTNFFSIKAPGFILATDSPLPIIASGGKLKGALVGSAARAAVITNSDGNSAQWIVQGSDLSV